VMPEREYEVYVQPFLVTEWRDGCVFRTKPQEHCWLPESAVKGNRPQESGTVYAAPSDEFSRSHMTIRIRKS